MNLRRIKHTLLRLTTEEKVIGIGSLIMFIGTFLPWYSVTMSFDKQSLTETGFSGDLGVIGFVIFLMSLLSILILIGENMRLPLPRFGYKREQIIFFFLAESFFLTLLVMAVYTKRSLEFTDAGLRFGIYTVLLGSFFGGLSAFALIQKSKRTEVKEFFSHEQEEEKAEHTAAPEQVRRTLRRSPELDGVTGPDSSGEELEQRVPEPMYFEEDMKGIEAAEEATNSPVAEEIPTNELTEIVPEAHKPQIDQSNYFKREAGVEKEEEKPKTHGGGSMGFYEDK